MLVLTSTDSWRRMDISRASLLALCLLALSVNALDPVFGSAPDEDGKAVPLNNDHLPVEMDTDHEQTSVDLPLEQGQLVLLLLYANIHAEQNLIYLTNNEQHYS